MHGFITLAIGETHVLNKKQQKQFDKEIDCIGFFLLNTQMYFNIKILVNMLLIIAI